MGMFDHVRCDMPLPDDDSGNPYGDRFQTKDLSEWPYMCTYRITDAGELVHEHDCHGENGRGDVAFHGVLNFYTCDFRGKGWREYNAKFTDGKCVGIERVEA